MIKDFKQNLDRLTELPRITRNEVSVILRNLYKQGRLDEKKLLKYGNIKKVKVCRMK